MLICCIIPFNSDASLFIVFFQLICLLVEVGIEMMKLIYVFNTSIMLFMTLGSTEFDKYMVKIIMSSWLSVPLTRMKFSLFILISFSSIYFC